ncbi:integrase catalytic domain-containing protein [Trichonephila clavipes]|nr:integrase catalytic domain-containing protein [Trichonephila clavipes]
MQQLWTLQIDWSERFPEKEASEWKEFVRSLVALNGINIERCIVIPNAEVIQLHGFCDASERAYGAAIYARSINPDGEIKVKLIASKSRVSPIKQVTMPRLELCSAVLLAKLMHKVKQALRMDIISVFFWTDSTIVLSWMKNESRNLKTFVANRVVIIQQLTELNKWHVPSEQNPADIISRGLDPEKIQRSELWLFEPAFLEVSSVNFPRYVDEIHNCEHYQRELKDNQESMCFLVQNREILPIIDKCSSFLKLQRILAWCVRFKENARNPLQLTTGSLTVAELSTALICLVRNVQSVSFAKEIWCLERRQPLPVSRNLLTLSPFLDERKILCVGGRLRHSNLPAQQKHPILIPNNHSICDLIIKLYHVLYLHTGTEATLANIRTRFWIVNGRSKVKGIIKQCIQCLKVSAKEFFTLVTQVEAVLNSRPLCSLSEDPNDDLALTPAHFLTGSPLTSLPDPDFKGIPMNRLRRWKLVQRMTQTFWSRWTSDYLNRLQSRPKWYKGNQKFKVNEVILVKGENNSKLLNWNLSKIIEVHPGTDDITGVVTLKTVYLWSDSTIVLGWIHKEPNLLKIFVENRVAPIQHLINAEQWHHVFSEQNPADLVSRGLDPSSLHNSSLRWNGPTFLTTKTFPERNILSSVTDSDEFNCEFKRAKAELKRLYKLVINPDPELAGFLVDENINWKFLPPRASSFGGLWEAGRSKWKFEKDNARVGDLVLIKEDNLAANKWLMRGLIEVFPGKDNRIRVVTIKTQYGVVKRPISKICILPLRE